MNTPSESTLSDTSSGAIRMDVAQILIEPGRNEKLTPARFLKIKNEEMNT